MIRHSFKGLFLVMVGVLLFGCAAQQMQPAGPLFDPYQLKADQYEPKVDNFMVILDASSSMTEKYNGTVKFNIAKDFLDAMNKTIPELKFNGALRSFGHHPGVSKKLTALFYGSEEYSTKGLDEGLKAVSRAGGISPLGKAINAASNDLKSVQGKIAVIVVSDGKDMGNKPVVAAQNMKGQFGDRLCIYTVLVGNNPAGKALLESVAKAGGCGFLTRPDEFKTGNEMAEFVKMVFLAEAAKPAAKPAPKPAAKPVAKPMDSDGDGVTDDKDQCPNTPKGATVDARGCWTYESVMLFDFDSDKIKPEGYSMLDEMVIILKENPQINVKIDGHTDNIGPAAYNMKLSERRSNAVKKYLIDKGVEAKRLMTEGFGLTKPAVGNDTKEGRAKNRRVELTPLQ